MALDDLRKRIDSIDDSILALLEERANVVEQVKQAKRDANAPVYDPERERRVLERLAAKGAGRFPRDAIVSVFREVMSACVSLQAPLTIAFLGPEGTFTHIAARRFFGLAARYTEAATIDGVFDAVRRGAAAYGVVPIENSTEGSVTHAVDALLEGGVMIRRELVLEVSHCLLSQATRLTEVERVYSHPQALSQCRGWLAKNLATAQLIQTTSTAAAAREAMGDPAGAAIGSQLAGELLGLPVLRERIQDRTENATRFVMIGRDSAPRTGSDKTTLGFAVKDERGALRRVLEIFDESGVNLTRIESRPSRKTAWEYVFLVDLEGHRDDVPVAHALAALENRCHSVTLLGSYPRHDGASDGTVRGAVDGAVHGVPAGGEDEGGVSGD
jgi:chorismate mutase/prephenate dehydratase